MGKKNPFFDFYHDVVEKIITVIVVLLVVIELYYFFIYFGLIGYITKDYSGSGSMEIYSFATTLVYLRIFLLIFTLLFSYTDYKRVKRKFSPNYDEYENYYTKKNMKIVGYCKICGRPIPEFIKIRKEKIKTPMLSYYCFCYQDNDAHNTIYKRAGYPGLLKETKRIKSSIKGQRQGYKNIFVLLSIIFVFIFLYPPPQLLMIVSDYISPNIILIIIGIVSYILLIPPAVIMTDIYSLKRLYLAKEPKSVIRVQLEHANNLINIIRYIEQHYQDRPEECFEKANNINYPESKKEIWFELGKAFFYKPNANVSDYRKSVTCFRKVISVDHHYNEHIIQGLFNTIREKYSITPLQYR